MPIKIFSPDDAYELIKESQLTPLIEQGPITAYYLRKYPNSRMDSTLIMFTPEGIAITGDLAPDRNGVFIFGYGLEWFVSHLEPSYLASKCLDSQVWDSDRAQNDIEIHIKEIVEEARKCHDRDAVKKARAIRDAVNNHWAFDNAHSLYECLERVITDYYEYSFGYSYKAADYAWLSAIQRRFAETYHEYRAAHPLPTESTHV